MSTATLPASGRMATYGWAAAPAHIRVIRLVIIVLLVPFAIYLVPRVFNLVHLTTGWELPIIRSFNPATLNAAKRAGYRYNPQLASIEASEEKTLASLNSLDLVATDLDRVRADVAGVNSELNILIGQVSGGLQNVLNLAVGQVNALLPPIDTLLSNLGRTDSVVVSANNAITSARSELAVVVSSARSAAGYVHSARQSADAAANIVAP